jgi:hypothetical protein
MEVVLGPRHVRKLRPGSGGRVVDVEPGNSHPVVQPTGDVDLAVIRRDTSGAPGSAGRHRGALAEGVGLRVVDVDGARVRAGPARKPAYVVDLATKLHALDVV